MGWVVLVGSSIAVAACAEVSSSSSSSSSSSGSPQTPPDDPSDATVADDSSIDAKVQTDAAFDATVDAPIDAKVVDAKSDADASTPTNVVECSGSGLANDADVKRLRLHPDGYLLGLVDGTLKKWTVATTTTTCTLTPVAGYAITKVASFDLDAAGNLYDIEYSADLSTKTFVKRDAATGAATSVSCTFNAGGGAIWGILGVKPDGSSAFAVAKGFFGSDAGLPGSYNFSIDATTCTASTWSPTFHSSCGSMQSKGIVAWAARGDADHAWVGCQYSVGPYAWNGTTTQFDTDPSKVAIVTDIVCAGTKIDVVDPNYQRIVRFERATGAYVGQYSVASLLPGYVPATFGSTDWRINASTDPADGHRFLAVTDSGFDAHRIFRIEDF